MPLAYIETFAPPRPLERLPGRRLLVLAPHPDDESLGCGGAIVLHVDAGDSVRVLFLGDGSQGNRALRKLPADDPQRQEGERRLAEARRAEAEQALAKLGVSQHAFLGARDASVGAGNEPLVQRLQDEVRDFAPDLVLLPFLTDRHRDHAGTTACLLEALRPLGLHRSRRLQFAGYEVWTTIYPNTVLDITAVAERKRAAVSCYRSQLAQLDYLEGVFALNRYRSMSGLFRSGYAEAYYVAPMQVLYDLHRRLQL